jgi:hypothetical protein
MALAWAYSSQALTMPFGFPDRLVAHFGGLGHVGEVEHLDAFVRLEGSLFSQTFSGEEKKV